MQSQRTKVLSLRSAKRSLSFLLVTLCFIQIANAQPTYRRTTESGSVLYSSKPSHSNDTPVALPRISREDFDKTISALQERAPSNCKDHEEVDCSRGPDPADGSVICSDGFRDAVQPFRFRCLEAKLSVAKPVFLDVEGEPLEIGGKSEQNKALQFPDSVEISVRNSSDIEAYGLQVTVSVERGQELTASGPEKIEPFGMGTFSVSLGTLSEKPSRMQLEKLRYRVVCTNCTAVSGGR